MPVDQAIETLIHEYYQLVFHTIYGLTGNWEESQDLTQDTFQQALKGLEAARAASGSQFHAKAWLLSIAVNTVRMQRRRRALFRFIPFSHLQEKKAGDDGEIGEQTAEFLYEQAAPLQPDGYGARTGDDPAEVIAERDAVRRTLARLPEPLRVCLLLSIVGGLSHEEIATSLSLKEAAVRQRLSRARKQFQEFYRYESGNERPVSSASQSTRRDSTPGVDSVSNTSHRALSARADVATHALLTARSSSTRRGYA